MPLVGRTYQHRDFGKHFDFSRPRGDDLPVPADEKTGDPRPWGCVPPS